MRKWWPALLILLLFPAFSVRAQSELWLKPLNLGQLEQIYKFYDYEGERGYLMLPSYHYPPLYLTALPSDFNKIDSETDRTSLFIKILAPLALKTNQNILTERRVAENLYQAFLAAQDLTPEQQQQMDKLAVKYDIFTPLQGYQRNRYLLSELLTRIDIFPPSFLIAVAALETDWGRSRIVEQGNNLYKQLAFYTNTGLQPQTDEANDVYRFKTYPSLQTAMQDFALRLNSHLAYAPMRNYRRELRRREVPFLGTNMAYTLLLNSPLKNYAGLLEYTIAFYELNIIDKSVLDSKMIEKPLPTALQKLINDKGNDDSPDNLTKL